MATETGSTFRNTDMGPELAGIYRQLQIVASAIEGRDDSYDGTTFTTITGAVDDALTAVAAALYANEHSS